MKRFGGPRPKERAPIDDDDTTLDPKNVTGAAGKGKNAAAGAAGGGAAASARPPPVDPTTNSVLQTTIDVRDDTLDALKRTEQNIELAQESTIESMKILKINEDILRRAEQVAAEMEVRSMKNEIMSMSRKLSRDKCFMTLAVLACIAVVVTIVLPLAKPRSTAAPVSANATTTTLAPNDQ